MLIYERQKNIVDFLKEKNSATVKQISKALFISEATVRRDVEKLQQAGYVERFYGGVTLADFSGGVLPLARRENENSAGKEKIAQQAAKLVHDRVYRFVVNGGQGAFAYKESPCDGDNKQQCFARGRGKYAHLLHRRRIFRKTALFFRKFCRRVYKKRARGHNVLFVQGDKHGRRNNRRIRRRNCPQKVYDEKFKKESFPV